MFVLESLLFNLFIYFLICLSLWGLKVGFEGRNEKLLDKKNDFLKSHRANKYQNKAKSDKTKIIKFYFYLYCFSYFQFLYFLFLFLFPPSAGEMDPPPWGFTQGVGAFILSGCSVDTVRLIWLLRFGCYGSVRLIWFG